MTLLFALFLGLVQGIAEFLPVSSSGHLAIFHNFFGIEDYTQTDLFFDILLHFGTFIAICVAYRKDIWEMIRDFCAWVAGLFNKEKRKAVTPAQRLVLLIVVATLPLFVVLPLGDYIAVLYGTPWFIGLALLVTAFLLLLTDHAPDGKKNERSATVLDVLIVGAMQALATLPGLSRSGATIATGTFRGFDRKFAVRFSFLLSIPAILGATALKVVGAVKDGVDWGVMPVYLAGMIVAGVTGYLALCLLRFLTAKGSFRVFAYYCALIGVTTILASMIVK